MKSVIAALAALMMLWMASAASAGVVVEEQETVNKGGAAAAPENRTLMIQGNKQKLVMTKETVVTDLDKGMVTMMDPSTRSYVELPFPPQGPMAAMMAGAGGSKLSFKKTGSRKKIAGYSCEEYTGSGRMMGSEYTVTGCFSNKAPGADDFDAFQKTMQDKVKGTPMAMGGEVPDGVPLVLNSTSKSTKVQIPGMAPDQAAKLNEMLAKRPPMTTSTTVTKITAQELPADTFVVPAGYQKQEVKMGPAPGGPPPSGGAPPQKVPE